MNISNREKQSQTFVCSFNENKCNVLSIDGKVSYYHPQQSWGKVIFSETCVKNSVHRILGYAHPIPEADTPPGSRHPHEADTPWEVDTY